MSVSVDIIDHASLYRAYRELDIMGGYIDGSTTPISIVISTRYPRRSATIGDTITRHDDGTITVTKTTAQEALW
ncbi:hypothetical protein [Gordonia sihwensis]|uniref:hypothetical protein n=1 Tax=Gordonia sihwensis TaxID=173559 RepID=UPI0005EFEC1F|nr:hypothetical protein [Gordonia sihwensis]KJR10248.1 hypothetical protein UG54_01325 [Gordonia sihwensis]